MKELKTGVEKFARDVYPWKRGLFEKLANGQAPHTLFITCSDSRIDPCLITDTQPGDLFVIRNAGNLVPPASDEPASGEQGTIEYAVQALGIDQAVVCGHACCGAIDGLMNREHLTTLPMVDSWLRHAEPVLDRVDIKNVTLEQAVKVNVQVQLDHLRTLPFVAAAEQAGKLLLMGWYYDIRTGLIEMLDAETGEFGAVL